MLKRLFRVSLALSTILLCFAVTFGVLCSPNAVSDASGSISFENGPAADIAVGDVTTGAETTVTEKDKNGNEVVTQILQIILNEDGTSLTLKKVIDSETNLDSDNIFVVPSHVNCDLNGQIVSLPITKIGDSAISFAGWLKTLIIPSTVKEIASMQFVYDTQIENIIFTGDVPIIGNFSLPSPDPSIVGYSVFVKNEYYNNYVSLIQTYPGEYFYWSYYSSLLDEYAGVVDDNNNTEKHLRIIEKNKIALENLITNGYI